MEKNLKMPEDLRDELSRAAVLYKIIEKKHELDSSLAGANRALQSIVDAGAGDFWEQKRNKWQITRKGELLWENWRARWWDYLINFDVFAGVDLQEGRFAKENADWHAEDEKDNLIWEDLRIAVCLRKTQISRKRGEKTALNPFSITFLALLSQGRLEQSREWQFDIAFDSIFWSEIENIVNSSLWPEELGYGDVSWEDVIDDIITQGVQESKLRWEEDDTGKEDHIPEEAYTSEEAVLVDYRDDIRYYGYQPGFFYYSPYWHIADTALAVGAIGLCWAMF